MGVIKHEEIEGYSFNSASGSEIVCLKCVTNEDLKDLEEDEILISSEMEQSDVRYFCDRCKKEL